MHPRAPAPPVADTKPKRRERPSAPTVAPTVDPTGADAERRRSARIANKDPKPDPEPEPDPDDLFEAGKVYTLEEILGKVGGGGVIMM